MTVQGLVTRLRLQQGAPVPLGAVGLAFDGTEVPPHQLGLLFSRVSIGVLRDPQSLELDLDVFGGAALPLSLGSGGFTCPEEESLPNWACGSR